MKVLDLFSGIGGFSLGLERAGMQTIAFCEIDPFCRAVLKKHWPNVPIFEDVTKLKASDIDGQIDVIAGGFPCQDISTAGRGAGLSGSRSGLWFEYHRLIKETQPQFAIIENVSALRSRGLDQVLRSLAEIGYDAEWHCIPASAVGAPHRRDRIWIVAYPTSQRYWQRGEQRNICETDGGSHGSLRAKFSGASSQPENVAHTDDKHGWSQSQHGGGERAGTRPELSGSGKVCDTPSARFSDRIAQQMEQSRSQPQSERSDWWAVEPDVGRVANGVPRRVDRLRALGNAVVPQIPEMIGRAIMDAMK